MGWFSATLSRVTQAFVVNQLGAELDRVSEALRSTDMEARLAAVKLLTTRPRGDADELLLAALRDADPGVRAAAASACGPREWLQFVPALGVLLRDEDAAVRAAALGALDELGTDDAALDGSVLLPAAAQPIPRDGRVPPMLASLLHDRDVGIRAKALAALPRHGVQGVRLASDHLAATPEAERLPLIALFESGALRAITSDDPHHRRAVVEALHAHRCVGATRALLARLKDKEPQVRQAAMSAVAALAPAEGLAPLISRLDDISPNVAARAIESLMVIHGSGALSPEDIDRLHARLLQFASHGEGRAQVAAAWALGEMGRVSAVRPLTALLDSKSDDVVAEACGALGRLRDPRAVTEACDVLGRSPSPRVRCAAAGALGAIGDIRAVRPLFDRVLADAEQSVVDAAEKALTAICAPLEEREREALESADPATRLAAIARVSGDTRATRMLFASILDAPDEACRAAATAALAQFGCSAGGCAELALRVSDQPETRRLFALSLIAAVKPAGYVGMIGSVLEDPIEPAAVYLRAVAILAADGSSAARRQLERFKEHPQPAVREAVASALSPPAA